MAVPSSSSPHLDSAHQAPFFNDPPVITPETAGAGARIRRPIPYHHSGTFDRDSLERNPQKLRPLVIVIPPAILLQQHGPLGHTLCFGAPQRLAQGIVMTLYPTMYAQLTAVSREFNFPSIAGLCLYLHYVENGITLTPRISDESWTSLWASALEGQFTSNRLVPITGTIEFDIDLRQARWYSSWLSSSSRDATFDIQHSAHSHTGACDRNGDNRTAVNDEHPDDRRSVHNPTPTGSLRRHFPKRLSLVDRFDIVNSKPSSPPSPEKVPVAIHALSPIAQESEPRSATQDLNARIQSWRNGALLDPMPVVVTGQISLEPASVPNTVDTDVLPAALDLEDYAWSVSSAGPEDYEPTASGDTERVPSVHLENRLIGSVCSTPSVGTSFGPLGDDFDPQPDEISYLPSPDLARRVIESAPLTPMTSTSWGLPSLPPLSSCGSYAASVDIGHRHISSPPLSASTATSWGAPLLDPKSPVIISVPATPDIGYRVLDDILAPLSPWPFSWPYYSANPQTDITTVEAWPFSWPYYSSSLPTNITSSKVLMPSEASGSQSSCRLLDDIMAPPTPWLFSWPYYSPDLQTGIMTTEAWPFSWPYYPSNLQTETSKASDSRHQYPYINIYHTVYPYFDLYPGPAGENPPQPAKRLGPTSPVISVTMNEYPSINLYTPVYPFFDIYPCALQTSLHSPRHDHESLQLPLFSPSYPVFNLYPPLYPFFDLYPSAIQLDNPSRSQLDGTEWRSSPSLPYPAFDLYPAIYPHFNIYPAITWHNPPAPASTAEGVSRVDVLDTCCYPILAIYPPAYPYFDLYPSRLQVDSAYSDVQSTSTVGSVDVYLKPGYPTIDIYLVVYPYFNIYPALFSRVESRVSGVTPTRPNGPAVDACLRPGYPTMVIYPAVYPYLDLYPAVSSVGSIPSIVSVVDTAYSGAPRATLTGSVDVRLKSQYPTITIYPAVYPYFAIYPNLRHPESNPPIVARYSFPDLYPAVTANLSTSPRLRPRHTHAQLHDLVLNEIPIYRKKSHHDLHQIAFPDGFISTPSGSTRISNVPDYSKRRVQSKLSTQNYSSPWDELKSKMADRVALQRSHTALATLHLGP